MLAFSQKLKQIELKQANSLEYDKSLGENVKRLIGNVVFEHEKVLLYCDSAYLYASDSLDAFANVHIQQGDSLNLYADALKYNAILKTAELKKNIRLIEKEMILTTELLNYDMNISVANYVNGGKIVNKENTLTSKIGIYYSANKDFFFKKDVVLHNPKYLIKCDTLKYSTNSKIAYFLGPTTISSDANFIYSENGWYNTKKDISQFGQKAYLLNKDQQLKGDTLYYDRKKGLGRAYGNVEIIDTTQHLTITGDYAEYLEKTQNSFIKGNTLLRQVYNNDTLFLHADLFRSMLEDTIKQDSLQQQNRILLAYNRVKFFKSDLQGKCDSLAFTYRDSTMRLFINPVLWSGNNQLTAEKMELSIKDGAINGVELINTSFIISEEDSLNYNQIQGKKMTGYFTENELYKIDVLGNGQSIYYAKDGTQSIGVNKVVCSDMRIFIAKNQFQKVSFITKPEAVFYPIGELSPQELRLKNFKWRVLEQPHSVKDIFIW